MGSGGRVTPKEILALWNMAVAIQRLYWSTLRDGTITDEIKEADKWACMQFINATRMSGPDGVAMGR